MTENNSLTTINTSITTTKQPKFGTGLMKKGIAAQRQQNEQKLNELDPKTVPNRIGMVFDDSGSMAGKKIDDAHDAVKNFTLSCNFQDTSIAVYPINLEPKPLTVDYDILNIFVIGIKATGGTELYTVLDRLITNESITRAVVFSDGEPTDSSLIKVTDSWMAKSPDYAKQVVEKYKNKELPVDTIFLGESHYSDETQSNGYKEMKTLAEMTGGVFIHFTDSSSLSKNLKYLAPKYRALLMSENVRERIGKGETI